MKKVLLLMVVMVSSIIANAKPEIYDFKAFVLGDDNTVTIVRTFSTSKNAEGIKKEVARNLSKDDGFLTLVSEENGVIKYIGQFQSQAYYNPMAGTTKRMLKFNLNLVIANNTVTLIMSDLKIQEDYVGYGARTTLFDVTEKMVSFYESKAKYNSPDFKSQPKNVKKEVNETLDDVSDIFAPSEEELLLRLKNLERAL